MPKRGFRFAAALDTIQSPAAHRVSATDVPSIAVLPFRNLTSDPEQDLLAEAMMDDLVMALSRVRWLAVIASASTITYRGRNPKPGEIAADLAVRYMLSGSIRISAKRLRVAVQLFDCAENQAIWAELYDREMVDLFDVQDDITRHVVASCEHEVSRAEQIRAERTRPENLDAWLAYQRAISQVRNGYAANEMAEIKVLFEKAIALDADFALAHAGRAFCEYWSFVEGLGDVDLDLCFTHAELAVRLDPREPFAHYALASIYWSAGSHRSAIDELQHALELDPSFAWAYHFMGIVLIAMGEAAAARENIEAAIKLSPRDTLVGIFYAGMALCHLMEQDYAGCIDWGRRAFAYTQPRWVHAYVLSALGHLGEDGEAREIRNLMSRIRSELSYSYVEGNFPILSGAHRQHFLEGLRLAGLQQR